MKARGVEVVYGWLASTETHNYSQTQVPIDTHRPSAPLVKVHTEWRSKGSKPALQGLSTLGGGYCHDLFLMLSPIHSPPPYLTPLNPFRTPQVTQISSDHT